MPTPRPKVLKSGAVVWRVQYRLHPGANPTSDTFDTYEDALNYCDLISRVGGAAAREIRIASTLAANPITVGMAFKDYIAHAATYAELGTIAKYERIWTRHIAPAFNEWPIQYVTKKQIQEWIGILRTTETEASIRAREDNPFREEEYLSAKTIANVQGLLSSVLKLQVELGILQVNPAKGVKLPHGMRTKEPVFLSAKQRQALISGAAEVGQEWGLFIEFMLSTGLRWSEQTALFPNDFDFTANPPIVRIDKAWKRTPNGHRIGQPKTTKSKRTVSIPKNLAKRLQTLAAERGKGELMWPGVEGGRLRDWWFYKRVWQPACERAGLDPAPRIHDLRHTHASMLLAQSVPIHIVQHRLGHESIQTTVNVYGHLVPDAGRIAAEAVEMALLAS